MATFRPHHQITDPLRHVKETINVGFEDRKSTQLVVLSNLQNEFYGSFIGPVSAVGGLDATGGTLVSVELSDATVLFMDGLSVGRTNISKLGELVAEVEYKIDEQLPEISAKVDGNSADIQDLYGIVSSMGSATTSGIAELCARLDATDASVQELSVNALYPSDFDAGNASKRVDFRYDGGSKALFLGDVGGSRPMSVDCTDFIKDGMLSTVVHGTDGTGPYIELIWNTDAGIDRTKLYIKDLIGNVYEGNDPITVSDYTVGLDVGSLREMLHYDELTAKADQNAAAITGLRSDLSDGQLTVMYATHSDHTYSADSATAAETADGANMALLAIDSEKAQSLYWNDEVSSAHEIFTALGQISDCMTISGGTVSGDLMVLGSYLQTSPEDLSTVNDYSAGNSFIQAIDAGYGKSSVGTMGYCITWFEMNGDNVNLYLSGDMDAVAAFHQVSANATWSLAIGSDHRSDVVKILSVNQDAGYVCCKGFSELNAYADKCAQGTWTHQGLIDMFTQSHNAFYTIHNTDIGNQTFPPFVGMCATGGSVKAIGRYTHAEGRANIADGRHSHVEGSGNIAGGACSHAEGQDTRSRGNNSHAEGNQTSAFGTQSHAEGYRTYSSSGNTHAEGSVTSAVADCAHAEGIGTLASGKYSHAEGLSSVSNGLQSHAEGSETSAMGTNSHTEGSNTYASWSNSHAEGSYTRATNENSHAYGLSSVASGKQSLAGGNSCSATSDNTLAVGASCLVSGARSFAGGQGSIVTGENSFGFGLNVKVGGNRSFATCEGNIVNGTESVAFGTSNNIYSSAKKAFAIGTSNALCSQVATAIGTNHTIKSDANYVVAMGLKTNASKERQFVWGGTWNGYTPVGTAGTFNVSCVNDISGFYIGRTSLYTHLSRKANLSSLSDYATHSEVTTQVGALRDGLTGGTTVVGKANAAVSAHMLGDEGGEPRSASEIFEDINSRTTFGDVAEQVEGGIAIAQGYVDEFVQAFENGDKTVARAYAAGEADWANIASRAQSLYEEDGGEEDERSAHDIFTALDNAATKSELGVKADVSSLSNYATQAQLSAKADYSKQATVLSSILVAQTIGGGNWTMYSDPLRDTSTDVLTLNQALMASDSQHRIWWSAETTYEIDDAGTVETYHGWAVAVYKPSEDSLWGYTFNRRRASLPTDASAVEMEIGAGYYDGQEEFQLDTTAYSSWADAFAAAAENPVFIEWGGDYSSHLTGATHQSIPVQATVNVVYGDGLGSCLADFPELSAVNWQGLSLGKIAEMLHFIYQKLGGAE